MTTQAVKRAQQAKEQACSHDDLDVVRTAEIVQQRRWQPDQQGLPEVVSESVIARGRVTSIVCRQCHGHWQDGAEGAPDPISRS